MNPKTLQFEKETTQMPTDWMRFSEGEIVEVKGIPMKISRITKQVLILRPVGSDGKVLNNPR